MVMRIALPLALVLASSPALADTFGGFSGVDAPYLVNRDRVCTPLEVKDGKAAGMPSCERDVAADAIARLSIKDANAQRGPKATFAATASGRTLTITRKASGAAVVTWTSVDPIGKIVDVYASQYEDRVAVAYTVRRLGRETTEVVGFVLVKTTGRETPIPTRPDTQPAPAVAPPSTPPPSDPKLDKAVASARKASRKKALSAWQAVLALDPQNSEAQYRIAAARAAAKQTTPAIEALETLAKSTRGDAIEWLVEARFDKAFATLRANPRFRAAVGLDRAAQTPYEKLMGFGGQWEQTGTSCDTPEVRLVMQRDRSFKLRVKSVCRGQSFTMPFKGTWQIARNGITLTLPTKGRQTSAKDQAPCVFERERDEDALRCTLDEDLEFVVLPTRR